MLLVLIRWVQSYLYCALPPSLQLGSVLPIMTPFIAVDQALPVYPTGGLSAVLV